MWIEIILYLIHDLLDLSLLLYARCSSKSFYGRCRFGLIRISFKLVSGAYEYSFAWAFMLPAMCVCVVQMFVKFKVNIKFKVTLSSLGYVLFKLSEIFK